MMISNEEKKKEEECFISHIHRREIIVNYVWQNAQPFDDFCTLSLAELSFWLSSDRLAASDRPH
jgi:hypothetical protein